MDSQQNIDLGIKLALGASAMSILSDANRSIKDFLSSNFVIFVLVLLVSFKQNDNILTSIALAFCSVLIVRLITADDYQFLLENFELIYPGPSSSINCLKITKQDLINSFEGDENKLKQAMVESGVPMNLVLDDINAPEIATYLSNNPSIKNIENCKIVI